MNRSFLLAVARALKPDGELRLATDHAEYFTAMQSTLRESELFERSPRNHSLGNPQTTFEKLFHGRGAQIHRLVLRKVSSRMKGCASQ